MAAGPELFPRSELSPGIALVELGVGAAPALVVGPCGGVPQQAGGYRSYCCFMPSELPSRGARLERSAELRDLVRSYFCFLRRAVPQQEEFSP